MPETDLELAEVHSLWILDLAFDIVAGLAFTAIAYLLVRHMMALGTPRLPPLATATAFILFVKGIGHLVHAYVLMWPLPGDGRLLLLARLHASGPAIWVADGLAAAAAMTYLLLRLRVRTTAMGTSLYDDLGRRQAQAMNLHDHVMQHIVHARWSMELDKVDSAAAMEAASQAVQNIIQELEAKLAKDEVVAPV